MNMSLVQQFCKSIQAPATANRYRDAGIGLLFIVLNQLLIIPTQIVLDLHSVTLPASILVMLLLAIVVIIAGSISEAVAPFYKKHLQGPSDFLGRHMSFGFVAFFLMLNRDHITDSSDIPKIAAAFVITTIMSYIAAFVFALGGFKMEHRIRGLRQKKVNDLESSSNKSWPSPSPSTVWQATPEKQPSKRVSQLSVLSTAFGKSGSLTSIEPMPRTTSQLQFVDFMVRTAPYWLCLFLLATVGLPTYLATRYEMPFEALSFILLWILCVQFQRHLRACSALLRRPRVRSALVILANPVLLTWALGSGYLWAKAACTGQPIGAVVSNFRRHNTLAESVAAALRSGGRLGDLGAHVGAGDLAGPILDAGIVCLGFKLYEYRAELWSSCGAVVATCTALAAVNVFVNAAVGAAVGLSRDEAVAFAGRSVTMALGVPAIENLGGSTTLMSAVAIFSGILFQMTGDWLFAVLRVRDRRCHHHHHEHHEHHHNHPRSALAPVRLPSLVLSENGATAAVGAMVFDVREKATKESDAVGCDSLGNNDGESENQEAMVVAAGVTVGINAAAMGTAFLIERDSRATAYSALAMTVFGAMTVALAALPGAREAMVNLTST
ncbi:hypothetical protein F4809DRAFT_655402 [Biscogniauxia mediterranea]|nr:hypothetical protein F4809DRAFT_655402 [Biscogniauxia mediterranea]